MSEPTPFDRLLRQAALYAVQHYPGEQARIGKGLTMALNNQVQVGILPTGATAWVLSETNPEVRYTIIETHCDCPDQAAPGQRCKHRWALFLMRMAAALDDMRDHEEETPHA